MMSIFYSITNLWIFQICLARITYKLLFGNSIDSVNLANSAPITRMFSISVMIVNHHLINYSSVFMNNGSILKVKNNHYLNCISCGSYFYIFMKNNHACNKMKNMFFCYLSRIIPYEKYNLILRYCEIFWFTIDTLLSIINLMFEFLKV